MKGKRQQLIREIIENNVIETQNELTDRLAGQGLDITQATVSRDIKEMGLVKIPLADGRHRYAMPKDASAENSAGRLELLFRELVLSFDYADNFIVIKCLPGSANAVADCFDDLKFEGLLGTIAGDDTIFMVMKNKDKIPSMIEKFYQLKG